MTLPVAQDTCEVTTMRVSSRTSFGRSANGTTRTVAPRVSRAVAIGPSTPGCSSSLVRISSPGFKSSAWSTALMPSVVEPVSATSAVVAPSSRAVRSRSSSIRSIWCSNHDLLLRPCSSCSRSERSAASNARAGTGPFVPAFR